MYKILIVEDDNTIAERLASHLKKWNYKTVCVRDFKNVMEEFKKTDPQLVILDIGLPFYNGFYWCQEIRKLSNVPIIFLSSMNDNMNIVMAMNMGGDEFIEKPFDLNVVTAKVQAVLRRAYALQGTANIIEHGRCFMLWSCLQKMPHLKSYLPCRSDRNRIPWRTCRLSGCFVSDGNCAGRTFRLCRSIPYFHCRRKHPCFHPDHSSGKRRRYVTDQRSIIIIHSYSTLL